MSRKQVWEETKVPLCRDGDRGVSVEHRVPCAGHLTTQVSFLRKSVLHPRTSSTTARQEGCCVRVCVRACVRAKPLKLCLTLCDLLDCSHFRPLCP